MLLSLSLLMSTFVAEQLFSEKRYPSKNALSDATSQDKLSVAPEITDVSDQKRVAVFTLVDGTLTITCDGIEGNVTVSTNSN